ncbi:MAG TPA: tetratricopeptide repeat protein [Thermoanaerobaculia bacterium]|nr:tetratricopeptide repeat protein [Thermoanaerobaculia bacterium]
MRRFELSAPASSLVSWMVMILCLAAGAAPASAQDTAIIPAGDPVQTLSRANDAYAASDFPTAIAGYRALLDSGHDHPLVHYDLGNAYLRQGELGRAIASYRRAAAGAPRDQDVSANLAYARKSARDAVTPPEPPMVWRTVFAWHYALSRSELWTAIVVLNTLLWALLALRLWRRSEALTWAAVVIAVLLAAGVTSLAFHELYATRVAVVLPREIDARAANQADSVVRFKLHAGSEVLVRGESGGWLRIVLPSGEQGWIEAEQAEVVEL